MVVEGDSEGEDEEEDVARVLGRLGRPVTLVALVKDLVGWGLV